MLFLCKYLLLFGSSNTAAMETLHRQHLNNGQELIDSCREKVISLCIYLGVLCTRLYICSMGSQSEHKIADIQGDAKIIIHK